jgi:tetratricopeptide (TPR) repeat protein
MRVLAALLMLSCLPAQAGEAETVFDLVKSSVVSVETQDEQGRPEGQGSGLGVGPERIVTNCHVVDEAHLIRVVWQGKTRPAALLRQDEAQDLCLLEVPGLDVKTVSLRDTADLKVGEPVYAVGNPLGFELSVSAGLVSALAGTGKEQLIHTSAPVSPGSSGGGLFDARGRLVGVTRGVFRYAQNYNIVVPAGRVQDLLASKVPLPPAPVLPGAEPRWEDEMLALENQRNWAGMQALAERWLVAHPKAATAHEGLGVALSKQGRNAEALQKFRKAVEFEPNRASAWRNQAYELLIMQRDGEARAPIKAALEFSHGQDFAAWTALGTLEYQLGHLEQARDAFLRASRLRPGDAQVWSWLGYIHHKLQQQPEAELAYRKALRITPDDVKLKQALAALKLQAGQDQPAVALLAELQPTQGGDAATLVVRGMAEQRLGRYVEAESAYRKAVALNPKNVDAWGALGVLLHKLGRLEEAESCLEKSVRLAPAHITGWKQLALAQQALEKFREAEASWSQACKLGPDDAESWMGLAGVRQLLDDTRGEGYAWNKVVQLQPNDAAAWAKLASTRITLNRNEDALNAAHRAIRLDKNEVTALNVLSVLAAKRGDLPQSLKYLDQAIAVQPGDPQLWNNKGYSLLQQGQHREAVRAFETAIRLVPDFAPSWINLGEAKLRQGQTSVAIDTLKRAIELAPQAVDARLYLAEAYVRALQPGLAEEHLKVARQKLPNHPRVWKLQVEMYLEQGDQASAQKAWERLADLDPKSAATLKSRLKGKSTAKRR